MSIQELFIKFKGFLANTEYLLALLIMVVALASFSLGRLSVIEKSEEIQQKAVVSPIMEKSQVGEDRGDSIESSISDETATAQSASGYVASKNGTKYHLPWCGSAKQIKEENKIWFKTKEEAEKAGYTPASNCKGI